MDHLDRYDDLINILTEEVEIKGKKYLLKDEFEKFYIKGIKASGPRIRKIMQLLRKDAENIRDNVQEYKREL